jgi:hypothetical protein
LLLDDILDEEHEPRSAQRAIFDPQPPTLRFDGSTCDGESEPGPWTRRHQPLVFAEDSLPRR